MFSTHGSEKTIPQHPWDVCIFYLDEWLILMVSVGKYTSPMDAMGMSQVASLSRCVRHMQGRPEAQMDGGSLQLICCPKQVV